jgi:GNAT superfamily N-acetyltransferase
MPDYPAHYESDVVLRDGSTIHLRPIRPDDAAKLLDLYHRLSRRSLYHRFFAVPRADPIYAEYLASVDYLGHFALVAEVTEQIVGVARYYRNAEFPGRAEAAFAVADAWQARGLGPLLLDRLAEIAAAEQISVFEGQALTGNQPMIKVLSRSRFPVRQQVEAGVFNLILFLAPQSEAQDRR